MCRDRGDFFDLDGVWTPAAQMWYELRLEYFLELCKDYKIVTWKVNGVHGEREISPASKRMLNEPGGFEWAVQWFVRQRDRFVVWLPDAAFCPSRESNGEWQILRVDVCDALNDDALVEYTLEHEAQQYTTLDDWLSALHDGELSEGPPEEDGKDLVDCSYEFRHAAKRRQRHWPIQCGYCEESFVRDVPTRVRCPKCLEEFRREREERRRARS